MSDVPETPDGAEAAQGAVEQQEQGQPALPEGWDGEWNPERAKSTIENLRQYERQAKRYETDLDAFRELAERHGFEIPEEGEEADAEPDYGGYPYDEGQPEVDPIVSTVEELRAWKEQQEEAQTLQEIAAHVVELTTEKGLDVDDQKWIFERASAPGYTPQRTQQIVNDYVTRMESVRQKAVDEYLKSKRADAPPQPGMAGEQKFDPKSPNAKKERLERIEARLMAAEE